MEPDANVRVGLALAGLQRMNASREVATASDLERVGHELKRAPALVWRTPASSVEPGRRDAHLWRARLDVGQNTVATLASTLTDDERERASTFRFPAGQRRFIVSRGILRHILARYVHTDPAALRFRYGPTGKPMLEQRAAAAAVRFNVSHSHELAVYAITAKWDVGVDIEHVRPIPEWEQLAERLFSATELKVLQELAGEEREQTFFSIWTRTEARLKATGEGLPGSMRGCDENGLPATTARREASRRMPPLRLLNLVPAAGYMGALAVRDPYAALEVTCMQAQTPWST